MGAHVHFSVSVLMCEHLCFCASFAISPKQELHVLGVKERPETS